LTRGSAGAAAFSRGRALPTYCAAGKAALRTCASRRPTTRPWRRRASGRTGPGPTSQASTGAARGRRPEVVATSGDGSCRRIHQQLHRRHQRLHRRHRRHHLHLHLLRRHRPHRPTSQWVTAHGRGVGRVGAVGSDAYPAAAFAEAVRVYFLTSYTRACCRCVNSTRIDSIPTGAGYGWNGLSPSYAGSARFRDIDRLRRGELQRSMLALRQLYTH
jgi:hypothetical protein